MLLKTPQGEPTSVSAPPVSETHPSLAFGRVEVNDDEYVVSIPLNITHVSEATFNESAFINNDDENEEGGGGGGGGA
ncbi:hypothetical protein L6452_22369 [Arctium lappa]|uniref:Uncharacterized protein n=1 Tax=Arctium lappa TaxID=4217 RepID=A0ACB9B0C4_ARCLA|nr:hypothetical protein L6452_22369 [Arctium lappa]